MYASGKKWVLEYLSSWKGTIPYELITDNDSLDIAPDNEDFFHSHQFFLGLKDSDVWPRLQEHEKFLQNTKTTKPWWT